MHDIAALVRMLEQQLDDVQATGARLKGLWDQARRDRGLSRVVGQQVDAAVGRAMSLSSQAVDEIVSAHRLMDKLAPVLGIDPAMYGDSSDDPAFSGTTGSDRAVVAA